MQVFLRVFVSAVGIFMLVQFFLLHPAVRNAAGALNQWANIVLAASIFLGVLNLIRVHTSRIAALRKGWAYSAITVSGICITAGAGLFGKTGQGGLFQHLFEHVIFPLEAMTFALLAFYIASASFRAFRVKSLNATVMLTAAVIVIIGRVPLGQLFGQWIVDLAGFLLEYPNAGAKRAMTIGVGLGAAAMSIKVILGIERTYLTGKGG